MEARERSAAVEQADQTGSLHPCIRDLLDHIAVELAEEYVRLMEAAAAASGAHQPAPGEDPS
jgi:hypothetical protein